VPPEKREMIVNDLMIQKARTGYPVEKLLRLYGISTSTYYGWFNSDKTVKAERPKRSKNYRALLPEEIEAIKNFRYDNPEDGYRKLTWMMVDQNIAFIPEITVYRLLKSLGMLSMGISGDKADKEYKNKPLYVHHHWHTDIAYIKIRGVFYYLIMMLDGYSRFLLNWELMTDMTEFSVSLFIQETRERYPEREPMLLMDNGTQFISKDFKDMLSEIDLQPVHTRRNHPQTNGKIERMNGTVKTEAIRKNTPVTHDEACKILNDYQYVYNYQRLHAGIMYLRPSDVFFGRDKIVLNERKMKILIARQNRIAKNKALEME
jgi:transposase-like protein